MRAVFFYGLTLHLWCSALSYGSIMHLWCSVLFLSTLHRNVIIWEDITLHQCQILSILDERCNVFSCQHCIKAVFFYWSTLHLWCSLFSYQHCISNRMLFLVNTILHQIQCSSLMLCFKFWIKETNISNYNNTNFYINKFYKNYT